MFAGLLNALTFTGTTGVTAIAGTTSFVTVANGPEGVLLKRVANIQEAINCGGLLLRNSADNRWAFYVGNTLTKVLESDSLGKVLVWPGLVPGSAHEQIDLTIVETWRGGSTAYQNDGTEYEHRNTPGFEAKAKMTAVAYFATDALLQVFGIVCSASDGSGVSHNATGDHGDFGDGLPMFDGAGLGYMSTEVPLNETFRSFFSRVKPVQMASVPESLKSYYEATYNEVMEAASYKTQHPTTAVCTYWRNGALWSGAAFTSRDVTRVAGDWGHGYAIRILDTPAWNKYFEEGTNMTFKGASVRSAGFNESLAAQSSVTYAAKHRWDVRPGNIDNDVTGLADLTYQTRYCTKVRDMVPGVGKVSGLNVGLLRDLHVLKRSKVDGRRFAQETTNYESVGAFVNDSVAQFTGAIDLSSFDMTSPARIQAALTSLPQIVSSQSTSIFSRGTLPYMIEHFNNAWDEAAKDHAEANS